MSKRSSTLTFPTTRRTTFTGSEERGELAEAEKRSHSCSVATFTDCVPLSDIPVKPSVARRSQRESKSKDSVRIVFSKLFEIVLKAENFKLTTNISTDSSNKVILHQISHQRLYHSGGKKPAAKAKPSPKTKKETAHRVSLGNLVDQTIEIVMAVEAEKAVEMGAEIADAAKIDANGVAAMMTENLAVETKNEAMTKRPAKNSRKKQVTPGYFSISETNSESPLAA
jgi:hypothetical protein